MTNDLIGDSISRIKNAVTRRKESVYLEYSKIIAAICDILKEDNWIADYEVIAAEKGNDGKQIRITLLGSQELKTINEIKRVSKPGLKIYRGYRDLKPVLEGYGTAILTTPKGILTDVQARKQKVGGEVICEIY